MILLIVHLQVIASSGTIQRKHTRDLSRTNILQWLATVQAEGQSPPSPPTVVVEGGAALKMSLYKYWSVNASIDRIAVGPIELPV